MNFDISNLDLVKFDGTASVVASAPSADPAPAGSAPLAADSIAASPLSYFGDMVQQIGRSISGEAAKLPADDPSAQGDAMNAAIDLLEGAMGLMSLYGGAGAGAGASDTPIERLQNEHGSPVEMLD